MTYITIIKLKSANSCSDCRWALGRLSFILLQYNELVDCKDKFATSAVVSLCSNNDAAGPYDQALDLNHMK